MDIFYGWVGVGGGGLWYILGGCGWVDIFYGWMGVGEGIFWVGGQFLWVSGVGWG